MSDPINTPQPGENPTIDQATQAALQQLSKSDPAFEKLMEDRHTAQTTVNDLERMYDNKQVSKEAVELTANSLGASLEKRYEELRPGYEKAEESVLGLAEAADNTGVGEEQNDGILQKSEHELFNKLIEASGASLISHKIEVKDTDHQPFPDRERGQEAANAGTAIATNGQPQKGPDGVAPGGR